MAFRLLPPFPAFRRGAGGGGGDDPPGPLHPQADPAPKHYGVRKTFADVPDHKCVPWYRMSKVTKYVDFSLP